MSEAEALLEIARAIRGLAETIAVLGILFLLFKNMGCSRD
jgi:hypothetical protein